MGEERVARRRLPPSGGTPGCCSGLPKASTPAEAAWLAAFRRDEGLSIAESARPFGERPATKLVEADGRITTVIGRLELEEFKVAIEAKQIDSVGNLFAKQPGAREGGSDPPWEDVPPLRPRHAR